MKKKSKFLKMSAINEKRGGSKDKLWNFIPGYSILKISIKI